MSNQICVVLDFGGQYNQLIARRVRDDGVYCEIMSSSTPISEIRAKNPMGIIFTGGPNSVYDESSPHISNEIFSRRSCSWNLLRLSADILYVRRNCGRLRKKRVRQN